MGISVELFYENRRRNKWLKNYMLIILNVANQKMMFIQFRNIWYTCCGIKTTKHMLITQISIKTNPSKTEKKRALVRLYLFFFFSLFLIRRFIIHTIINKHTNTSPNIIMNTEPPTLIISTVITVNMTTISNKIINSIISLYLLFFSL